MAGPLQKTNVFRLGFVRGARMPPQRTLPGKDCRAALVGDILKSFKVVGSQGRKEIFRAGQSRNVDKLWREFFSDPSQWWDHRSEKENTRYPDFKHKTNGEALWVDSKTTPPWVDAKLVAMVSGTVQLNVFSWNKRLARYAKSGQFGKTMELFQQMQNEGLVPDRLTFIPVLNACASLRALQEGRQIHSQILQIGCESDIYVSSSLLDMYAKCGSIDDAQKVFNKMPTRDVVTWNVMILGYVKSGQAQKALELSQEMQSDGVNPVAATFVGLLNACASVTGLDEGRQVHEQIITSGCESDAFVVSSLVDMYAKCGSLDDAWTVFSKMPKHDVVVWNAMILGHVKCGYGQRALDLYEQMQQEGVEPDRITFVGLLNACASVLSIEQGEYIHEQIIGGDYESDIFVGNSLIDMYAKCGRIEDAGKVFDKMPRHDVVAWNTMILGLVKCGQGQKALELSREMQLEGVNPVPTTFVGLLNACGSVAALHKGRQVHEQIIKNGCESDVFVVSSLVDMYAKCGSLEDAGAVFSKMSKHDVVAWNALILGHVKCGHGQRALELYQQMHQEGVEPDRITFVGLVNACASVMSLEEGKCVHEQITQSDCQSDIFVGNSLIDMYAKCGSIEDSKRVFDEMPRHDVISWNTMILGLVKCGQGQKALELSREMQLEGVAPVPATFVGLLNACASIAALDEGRQVHEQIIKSGCESDVFVSSSLVDMYAKCGSIQGAWSVFNNMPKHDVVAWNSMILGHVKCGHGQRALELYQQMQQEGVEADRITFVGLLNACVNVMSLEEGRCVHEQITQNGCESDIFVGNSLIDMYTKCGSIEDAGRVFEKMPSRDVVAWNTMILGLVKCGQAQKALEFYKKMQLEGLNPVSITFVGVFNACASLGALDKGRFFHDSFMQSGLESDVFIGSSLVNMYAKCGSIEEAGDVFDQMPARDVVAWNTLILGHVKCALGYKALQHFQQMQQEGVEPDHVTFTAVLNACASVGALDEGRGVHEQVRRSCYKSDIHVGSSLIDMYWKCGSVDDALRAFTSMPTRNVISWNSMILGYVKCGQARKALHLFRQMQMEEVEPVPSTFVGLLNACASLGALEEGKLLHEQIIESCFESDLYVSTSLVDMYAKCGSIDDAWVVFKRMPARNVVSWNSIIMGYVKSGQGQKALELFRQMEQEGVEPDSFTFVSALNACASVVALEQGRYMHNQIIQRGFESDVFVGNSLVHMYGKCGSLDDAQRLFGTMPTRNMVSWNAMLQGYGTHGRGMEALTHFEQMYRDGVEIDGVTFISLLSACSHAGLIDEGLHYFESMSSVYGVSLTIEHYACIVDLLGRAGYLNEADDIMKTMSCKPDESMWMSLLGACRVHGNVEMGELTIRRILELDPTDSAGYVLLSNIYAAAGKWDSQASIQQQRMERGLETEPGLTWIEVNNDVPSFTIDDHELLNK